MGVRLMNLGEGDTVVAVASNVEHVDDDGNGDDAAAEAEAELTDQGATEAGRRGFRRRRASRTAVRRGSERVTAETTATTDVDAPDPDEPAVGGTVVTSAGGVPVRTVRRAKVAVTRVDPWSVMKISFALFVALGIVLVIAVAVLWWVLDSLRRLRPGQPVDPTITGTDNGSGNLTDNSFQLKDYISLRSGHGRHHDPRGHQHDPADRAGHPRGVLVQPVDRPRRRRRRDADRDRLTGPRRGRYGFGCPCGVR